MKQTTTNEKKTTNAQYWFGKSGGIVLRMTVFTKFEVRCFE